MTKREEEDQSMPVLVLRNEVPMKLVTSMNIYGRGKGWTLELLQKFLNPVDRPDICPHCGTPKQQMVRRYPLQEVIAVEATSQFRKAADAVERRMREREQGPTRTKLLDDDGGELV
jgi:hypothetical protein